MVSKGKHNTNAHSPSLTRADEKYLIGKHNRDIDEYEHFARENAKDIIAVGFNPDRTFIFSDYGFVGGDFYRNITRVAKVGIRQDVQPLRMWRCTNSWSRELAEERQMLASASTRAPILGR
jgi:hypothetical protein